MTQTSPPVDLISVDLGVTGMTCTSCSSRVQRKLNKVEGVDATVNFSTETASVTYDPSRVDETGILDIVRNAGYEAFTMVGPEEADGEGAGAPDRGAGPPRDQIEEAREREVADLRQRLIGSAILTVPITLLSMIPALQFTNWQWAVLTMTTLVYFWGGAPFHRATLTNLRHGGVTMDTLITLGTTAAYVWSLWALFLGDAGVPGMTMQMHLLPTDSTMDDIYLETAAVVITFLLLGRWFETKAKGRSSEALRTLLDLGAKDAVVLRDGAEVRVPVNRLQVGEVFVEIGRASCRERV